jgi:hypothetical protein
MHSLILSWGRRLELEADGDVKKEFSPVQMRGSQELRITQISVGHEHTVAIGGSLWCEVHGLDESFYIIRAAYAPSIEEMSGAVLTVCCTYCVLYLLCAVLTVCCTYCVLCSLCTVLTVYCTPLY